MSLAFDPAFANISALCAAYDRGDCGPVALTELLLARIASLDPHLGAFSVVTAERARREAAAAQETLAAGKGGNPLLGIPYAVKDLFDVAGEVTTAGTRLREQARAASDCKVVERLCAAGMILLGKTHTTQLACDVTGFNPDFGTPHNPWQREAHVPGGSSCGSGVAVAAGLVPVALGTDTGGSVRIPASLCGTVGLKPTLGRIPSDGIYPLCKSLDSFGPMTRSVRDAALLLAAMQGPVRGPSLGRAQGEALETAAAISGVASGNGASAGNGIFTPADKETGVAGMRFAIDEGFFLQGADAAVAAAFRDVVTVFRNLGARVEDVGFAPLRAAGAVYWWHYFAPEAYAVNRDILARGGETLDSTVRWIEEAVALDPQETARALRRRAELCVEMADALAEFDGLLAPTTGIVARPLAEVAGRHADLEDVFARNALVGNILGLCGVSLPCGFTNGGLPIGLTVYGKADADARILSIAQAYEQATSWHLRRPDLSWTGQAEAEA